MNILTDRPAAGAKRIAKRPVSAICLYVRETAQIFDSLDPCPFHERDLDADAEEYIVASAQELPRQPTAIMVYLDGSSDEPAETRSLEKAIREHFARRRQLANRELCALLRRGWISLLIGLAFLASLLVASEAVGEHLSPGPLATVLTESLVIGGWVALWRPLEIFLYDWWPVVGQRRTYELLSKLPVNLAPASAVPRSAGIRGVRT